MKKVLVYLVVFSLLLSITGCLSTKNPKVEIFSWWTGGGEAEGLDALIEVFQEKNPDFEVINATVAGGAGSNAQAVLKTRMVGNNPPDSFQVHGGSELIDTYVKTEKLEPITKLVDLSEFNQQIISMCSYDGEVYAVPVNVHRGNVLWGNSAILAQNDIKMPATMNEFIDVCQKLKNAGVTPLALGDTDKWAATHLFEDVLAAVLGPEKYNGLWDGTTSFSDPGLKQALNQFIELINYVNSDHSALGWQDAAARVFEGKAAFTVMGDWAEGYFKSVGWTPGEEFLYAPFPGTVGSFMVVTDSFCLPKNAPNRKGAIAWLKTAASLEGQDAFNPLKGSIPARLDGNKDLYDEYLTSSMNDFANNDLMPSIAHGSAAPGGFIAALSDTINIFIADKDLDKAAGAIEKAAAEYLQ